MLWKRLHPSYPEETEGFQTVSPLPEKPFELWVSEIQAASVTGVYVAKQHFPVSANSILHALGSSRLCGLKPEVPYPVVCGWEVASL